MCRFPNQKIGEHCFSRSYGIILPSSFDIVFSSALVYSTCSSTSILSAVSSSGGRRLAQRAIRNFHISNASNKRILIQFIPRLLFRLSVVVGSLQDLWSSRGLSLAGGFGFRRSLTCVWVSIGKFDQTKTRPTLRKSTNIW